MMGKTIYKCVSIFAVTLIAFAANAFSQTNNSWKTVGYGGGGAMFYPEVSPFNPDFAFVSCDMTG
ncbi:MAG: hypothetical protein EOO00_06530 [Chitinophagaceae bacterium]|nr:MAG: hypothetical protein EOO00_06530 [Chitinophagaceae bacterium]